MSWIRFATALAVASAAGVIPVAVGCGGDQGLVGGNCASGYAPCGNNCCPVTTDASSDVATDMSSADADGSLRTDGDGSSIDALGGDRQVGPGGDAASDAFEGSTGDGSIVDGSPVDGSPADGSPTDGAMEAAETGPLCMPPLTDCGGMCVDTTSDPSNCGTCNNVCVSQICVTSLCVGSTAGGIVFLGHDYLTTPSGTSQAHVLSNAVFIPQNNPLHIMSYDHYASAAAVARVKAILMGAATQIGRTIAITDTSVDADIPNRLVITSFQVLVVEDQPGASPGAMAALGASWASTLATFTHQGGIVVVLDGGTGVGEMPQLSTGTGLLAVTAQSSLANGTPLDVVAPGDSVGTGVVSPYGAGKNSVTISTEPNGGNVIYVVEQPSDAGPGAPVVVHKLF
jgi:hypothetical protein